MEAVANLRYLRISPRKVKIVLDLIRGKDVATATAILLNTPKAASEPVLKLLKSAAANAENNHQMDPEKLYVSACYANPGPIIKRIMPRAPGPGVPHQQAHLSRHHRRERALREEEQYGTESQSPRPSRGRHQGLGLPLVREERAGRRPAGGDKKIRDYLKKTLYGAGIPKIEIERDNAKVRIYLHCARPGVVIGKGGEEIKALEAKLVKMIGKPVDLKIVEVRNSDMDAQLVAENIAQQLEKRIGFRRAMKNAMGRAMRAGALGIKDQRFRPSGRR